MELINLPDELLVIIVQFIESMVHYYNIDLKMHCKHQAFTCHELFSVYDLVCTCKRFEFLKYKKYLILRCDDDIFLYTTVNYMGLIDGPQYWKLYCEDIWYGYINDKIKITGNYNGCEIVNKKYYFEELDYDGLCSKIYEKFDDQEILNFMHNLEYKTKEPRKEMLIRKQFPKLDLDIPRLKNLIKSYIIDQ